MAAVVSVFALTTHLTRGEPPFRPPHFVETVLTNCGRDAAAAYESGGADALRSYFHRVEHDTGIRMHLFDASGAELSGHDTPERVRAAAVHVARTGEPYFWDMRPGMLEVRPVGARGGGRYAFVTAMPMGPPRRGPHAPFGIFNDDASSLVLRVLAVILAAGALCYMLARYIVAPVVKLRDVTRQVTEGDLSARVGPRLGKRRDELAAMGHDFDEMASRVETLLGAQARLLRDISHELRSPLARLSVALDLARKRAGAAAAGDLDRIEREAKRLNEMIGQLLTLSRQESDGGGVARAERVALAALVREVAADADFEAQGRGCSVVVGECEECELSGSPSLLRSAVENVVRNAVRYTPEGTAVSITLKCLEAKRGGAGEALVAVRDEGAGVPEDALADIFRPFYRIDDSRARETGGAGLGLAITERAVRLHGGTVTASNPPGGGFVVELRFPLGRAAVEATGR